MKLLSGASSLQCTLPVLALTIIWLSLSYLLGISKGYLVYYIIVLFGSGSFCSYMQFKEHFRLFLGPHMFIESVYSSEPLGSLVVAVLASELWMDIRVSYRGGGMTGTKFTESCQT